MPIFRDWLPRPVTSIGSNEYNIPEVKSREQLSLFAFPKETAVLIKERSNWQCDCGRGRGFTNGNYLVDASHLDHNRNNPYYTNERNGICECLICHASRHIDILEDCKDPYSSDYEWAWFSVRAISQRIWDCGLHDRIYKHLHKESLEDDRTELFELFYNKGLDLFDFISIDKPREC